MSRRSAASPRSTALVITLAALVVGCAGAIAGDGLERQLLGLALRLAGTPTASSSAPPTEAPMPTAVAARALGALPVQAARHAAEESFGRIRQLSFDGCCAGAWWAADSQALHLLDRPEGAAQTGIYAIPVWPPGSPPEMVDTRLNMLQSGTRHLVRPAGDHSIVKEVESGLEWPLPTGGNPVRLSEDGLRAVWWEARGGRAQIDALGRVFSSTIDGADAGQVAALYGVEVLAFIPGSHDLLILGRPHADRALYQLLRVDSATGQSQELASGLWLDEVALSPGGSWVAYTISLDAQNPEANGVWVAPTAAGGVAARKLEVHGAYRWRDDRRLVYVPMIPGAPSHALVEYDTESGGSSLLYDPAEMPLRITGNDWSVSPDGSLLAFRSAEDRNIWVVDLPE